MTAFHLKRASWRECAGLAWLRSEPARPQGQELQFRPGCPIHFPFLSRELGRAVASEAQAHSASANAVACAVRSVARDVLSPIAVCFQHLGRAFLFTFPFRSCTLLHNPFHDWTLTISGSSVEVGPDPHANKVESCSDSYSSSTFRHFANLIARTGSGLQIFCNVC